jgi:hypothetical protein
LKKILFLVVLLVGGLLLVSCMSSPPPIDIPDWYMNPPRADDSIFGVGSARLSTLDKSRTMAVARARTDIGFQVETSLKAAIRDYAQEAGVDMGKQAVDFIETVSKQIAEVTLSGVKIEKVAVGMDGTVYAMASFGVNKLKKVSEEQFKQKESAAWAGFKADQADKWLDDQIKNKPPRAGQSGDAGKDAN